MKSNIEYTRKQAYKAPNIERIIIDSDISLQLDSGAPAIDIGDPEDPNCSIFKTPEYFNNSPFA